MGIANTGVHGPGWSLYGIWNLGNGVAQSGIHRAHVLNTLGYIPILSLLPGIVRIRCGVGLAHFVPEPHSAFPREMTVFCRAQGRALILRGVLEVCQLGIPLALIDLIVSSIRTHQLRRQAMQSRFNNLLQELWAPLLDQSSHSPAPTKKGRNDNIHTIADYK